MWIERDGELWEFSQPMLVTEHPSPMVSNSVAGVLWFLIHWWESVCLGSVGSGGARVLPAGGGRARMLSVGSDYAFALQFLSIESKVLTLSSISFPGWSCTGRYQICEFWPAVGMER